MTHKIRTSYEAGFYFPTFYVECLRCGSHTGPHLLRDYAERLAEHPCPVCPAVGVDTHSKVDIESTDLPTNKR